MLLKLDRNRLHDSLLKLPKNVLKTARLLITQEDVWLTQVTKEYLNLCPRGSVEPLDTDQDQDNGLYPDKIMPDKPWCNVAEELSLLASTASDLSDRIYKLSSSAMLMFYKAIQNPEKLEINPSGNEYPSDNKDASIHALAALGYVFLPLYCKDQIGTESEITFIDDKLIAQPPVPMEGLISPKQGSAPLYYPNMNSERATELIMFAKLCQSLASIARQNIGSNNGNPLSEKKRMRWLIWKIADKLASIQTPKPISPSHAITITHAILNSLRPIDGQKEYSRTEGDRAIRAWRAQQKEKQ